MIKDLICQFLESFSQLELKEKVEKRIKINANGCWIWVGYRKDSGCGIYGMTSLWKEGLSLKIYAHRLAYIAFVGSIPEGRDLDHLCRVTLCVNPKHLEPVTRQVNLLRGDTVTAKNHKKTHCPSGHAYDLLNTKTNERGWRRCRICVTATNHRKYLKRSSYDSRIN